MTPASGAKVELHDPEGRRLSTSCLFVTDTYIAVGRPEHAEAGEHPDSHEFELFWAGNKGVHMLPVIAHEREGRNGEPLWELTPVGVHQFIQRRAFVRVKVSEQIQLIDLSTEELTEAEATMIDISEASLQCSVPGKRWLGLTEEQEVRVRFTLADLPFASNGYVLRAEPIGSEEAPQGAKLIVRFTGRPDFTERLRGAVFEVQRRQIVEERERQQSRVEDQLGG